MASGHEPPASELTLRPKEDANGTTKATRRAPDKCNEYKYSKLPSDQHFRVLELYPKSYIATRRSRWKIFGSNKGLYGSLSERTVSNGSCYECLSYTWGSSDRPKALWVNGTVIWIGQNVMLALRRLQHPTQSRFLWMDQICIDQENLDERKDQVELMFKIYSEAIGVMAYLGEEADGSQRIPELLRKLNDIDLEKDDLEARIRGGWKHTVALGLPGRNDEIWVSLAKFLSRPWFIRIWIVQEVFASQTLHMMCGDWIEPAKFIHSAIVTAIELRAPCFRESKFLDRNLIGPASRGALQVQFMNFLADTDRTLIKMLEDTRYACSTDPRDRVYALLNLCADVENLFIEPDYSLDPAEVFKRLAHALVRQGWGARLLLNAGIGSSSNWSVPSWVADWSLESFHVVLVRLDDRVEAEIHSRSFEISPSGNDLWVPALFLDRIDDVRGTNIDLSDESFGWCLRNANAIRNLIRGSQKYKGFDVDEVTWRTFLCYHANWPSASEELPEGFVDCFYSWHAMFTAKYDLESFDAQYAAIAAEMQDGVERLKGMSKGRGVAECPRWYPRGLRRKFPAYLAAQWENGIKFGAQIFTVFAELPLTFTQQGYIGKGPIGTKPGDFVVCIKGVAAPMVVRPIGDQKFQLVGAAFFHGFMKGESRLAELEADSGGYGRICLS